MKQNLNEWMMDDTLLITLGAAYLVHGTSENTAALLLYSYRMIVLLQYTHANLLMLLLGAAVLPVLAACFTFPSLREVHTHVPNTLRSSTE